MPVMDVNEITVKERWRADVYRMLSACYCQPEKTMMEENLFGNLKKTLKMLGSEAYSIAKEVEKTFGMYQLKDLLVDYSRLFVGPFELLAPPYGSVYLEEGKRVMGDSTIEVRNFYEKMGLKFSNDFKDVPDHISVELEFISFLIVAWINAFENNDMDRAEEILKYQQLFLETYLEPWLPEFVGRIKKNSDTQFYKNLADCTLFFISEDMKA